MAAKRLGREAQRAHLARQWLVGLGVVLLALTFSEPAHAYRTASDLPAFRQSLNLPVNWARKSINYRLNTQLPVGLTEADMAEVLVRATAAWSEPSCTGVRFTSEGFTSAPAEPGDAINTVQWLFSGWEEHGFPTDSAGATDILYEKDEAGAWHIVEADLYLNATVKRQWVAEPPAPNGAWDLLSVATHELGHVAGLLHPCELEAVSAALQCDGSEPLAETTMYPTYSLGQSSLEADDVDGICFLYPEEAGCDEACADGMTCLHGACVVDRACGDAICEDNEECREGRCVAATPCGAGSCNPACKVDADCTSGLSCVDGRCSGGAGLVGDSCKTSRECSGACSQSLYCAPSCETDEDCGDSSSCSAAVESDAGVCEQVARPMGANCDDAGDCLGQQCLSGYAEKDPFCTRLCGADLSAGQRCPGDWRCARVDGESVCVPPPADEGCSCRLVGGSGHSGAPVLIALGAFAACVLRRRTQIRKTAGC